jgi:hypothetical protein
MGAKEAKAVRVKRVEAWSESGLSRVRWCHQEGVRYSGFLKWVRRLRPEASTRRSRKESLFVELEDHSQGAAIEIRAGVFEVRVQRGFDAEVLGARLRVLESLSWQAWVTSESLCIRSRWTCDVGLRG